MTRAVARRCVAAAAAMIVASALAACASPSRQGVDRPPELVPVCDVPTDATPRVLCVVAHPDDEIAFAGTLFKTATALGGACDVFTITNGEGGFKYATLAERIYGLDLTDEATGRRELPEIRKRELAAGCRWLGVRSIHFLREKDHRYTQDLTEVLGPDARAWDIPRVRRQLDRRLADGAYDFVLVHLPTAGTHAHHVAATVLALEAVARMPAARRPVVLGARVAVDGEAPPEFAPPAVRIDGSLEWLLGDLPLPHTPEMAAAWNRGRVRLADGVAPFVFDRRQKFGHQDKLDYGIVVAWAVAEHRSQGTMQQFAHRGDREEYLLFAGGPDDAAARAAAWFESLARPQFAPRVYAPSAGTNH